MHSRSPLLHNYWFRQHDLAGTYVPLAIPPTGLQAALRALYPLGFAGCNLTLPHKQEAMKWVDEVDSVSKNIGAISCVIVRTEGGLAVAGFVPVLGQGAAVLSIGYDGYKTWKASSMSLSVDVRNDIKAAQKLRLPWWGLLIILVFSAA